MVAGEYPSASADQYEDRRCAISRSELAGMDDALYDLFLRR